MNFNCVVIIFLNTLILAEGLLKFTNVKCKEFDTPFATFDKCYLKLIKRGVVGLNIHVKLFQVPVNNVSINLGAYKKYSGFRPFLYNFTTDFCKLMANRKLNLFMKLYFDALLKESNINHTCPYNHDIIVKDLVMKDSMLQQLPVPSGEYMLVLKVGAYNDWKADVRVYITQNEKLNQG